MGEPRVTRPGDPDHPAEQVRRAGERKPRAATYQAGVTLRAEEAPIAPPTVAEIETAIKLAISGRWPQFDVTVSAMRTDR